MVISHWFFSATAASGWFSNNHHHPLSLSLSPFHSPLRMGDPPPPPLSCSFALCRLTYLTLYLYVYLCRWEEYGLLLASTTAEEEEEEEEGAPPPPPVRSFGEPSQRGLPKRAATHSCCFGQMAAAAAASPFFFFYLCFFSINSPNASAPMSPQSDSPKEISERRGEDAREYSPYGEKRNNMM